MRCSIGSKLALGVLFCAVAQLPGLALAYDQRDSSTEEATFPAEPVIPQRDVTFEESDEPYSMQLFAADPMLLEQKYVATVHFKVPSGAVKGFPDEMQSLFMPIPKRTSRLKDRSAAPIIKELVESAPLQRRPDDRMISLLSDPQHLQLDQASVIGPRGTQLDLVFLVLGPDVEDVKTKAQALIELYDYGLSYPSQQSLIVQMQRTARSQHEAAVKLTSEKPKVERLQKRLQQYEPISVETFADLKTQQRLISVDIAGVKARIDACSSILKREEVRGRPIAEQVESAKISAEIELVGLMARKDALDEIIQQGTKRSALENELAAQQKTVTALVGTNQSRQRFIESAEATRTQFLPFTLQDNTIAIRPLKWEPGASGGF